MARPGPALFELIRDSTGTRQSSAPARPAAPSAPAPAPRVDIPAPRSGDAHPAFDLQRTVSVSMQTIWLAVGAAILAAFAIWVIAWLAGKHRGEQDSLRDFKGASPGITEPLRNPTDIPLNKGLVTPGTSPQLPKTSTEPPIGSETGDPRVAGLNYLVITSRLDREAASRIVNFLSENALPAIAVAVVKGTPGANNPPTYTVYALQGITRDQYRSRAPQRTELEDKVTRLGKTWQKDHKGQTNFSQFNWEKYGS